MNGRLHKSRLATHKNKINKKYHSNGCSRGNRTRKNRKFIITIISEVVCSLQACQVIDNFHINVVAFSRSIKKCIYMEIIYIKFTVKKKTKNITKYASSHQIMSKTNEKKKVWSSLSVFRKIVFIRVKLISESKELSIW